MNDDTAGNKATAYVTSSMEEKGVLFWPQINKIKSE